MRYLAILIGLGILGYIGFTRFMPAPGSDAPPPPPPEKPAILEEAPPMVLSPEALDRVRTATRDTDPTVRMEALQFLIGSRDPQADEIMMQMLHQDSEPQIRRQITTLLGRRRPQGALEHLGRRLRDTDPNVRLAAVESVVALGDAAGSEYLGELLHDSNEQVRLSAIKALNDLQTKQAAAAAQARTEHDAKMRAWEEQQRKAQGGQK